MGVEYGHEILPKIESKIDFTAIENKLKKNKQLDRQQWWVVLLIDEKTCGHTRLEKTVQPYEFLNSLPLKDGEKSWVAGVLVEVGYEEMLADRYMSYLTGSRSHKQIRGIMSRSVMACLLAEHFELAIYLCFDNILGIKGSDRFIFGQ